MDTTQSATQTETQVKSSEFVVNVSTDEKRCTLDVVVDNKLYNVTLDPIFMSKYKPLTVKTVEYLFTRAVSFTVTTGDNHINVVVPYELRLDDHVFSEKMEIKLNNNDDNNLKTTFLLNKRIRTLEKKLESVAGLVECEGVICEPKQKKLTEEDLLDDFINDGIKFLNNRLRRRTNPALVLDLFGYC